MADTSHTLTPDSWLVDDAEEAEIRAAYAAATTADLAQAGTTAEQVLALAQLSTPAAHVHA